MLIYFWGASLLVILALAARFFLASFQYDWLVVGMLAMSAFACVSQPLFQNDKKYEGWISMGLGLACALAMIPLPAIGIKIMGFLVVSVVAMGSGSMILSDKSTLVKAAWYASWTLFVVGAFMLLPQDNDLAIIPFLFAMIAALFYLAAWRYSLSRLTIGYIGGCIVSAFVFGVLALVVFRSDPFGLIAVSPLAAWHGMVCFTGICLVVFDNEIP